MKRRILTVVGARPQFIKAAALSRVFAQAGDLEEILVHTGQHHDKNMSAVFFEDLAIAAPKRHLEISGGGHGDMTGRMLVALERAMQEEKPDAVLIYGDTNSTLAGALAAAKLHIPVVHVEAGLRSFNRRMPEEVNRVLADHVSALLLCPTDLAVQNLKLEGITGGVRQVGDVMYDTTLHATEMAAHRSTILKDLGIAGQPFALCTLHRAETTDDPKTFERALAYLEAEAKKQTVVFPVHPRTRKTLEAKGRSLAGVQQIPPVGYLDMHSLLGACSLVLTDSGGLQKEAYFHRKPCVTLREETEWVETLDAGWNRLWASADWKSPRRDIPDYGDGHAADKCVEAVRDLVRG
jgi:UDP-GlcNAc3NAcA epimerase